MRHTLFAFGFFSLLSIQTLTLHANCDLLCDHEWWKNADITALKKNIQKKEVKILRDKNGATPLHYAAISNSYPKIDTSLYEVQIENSLRASLNPLWSTIRDALRPARSTVGTIRLQNGDKDSLTIKISKKEGMDHAIKIVEESLGLNTNNNDGSKDLEILSNGDLLILKLTETWKKSTQSEILEYTLDKIKGRLEEISKTAEIPSLPMAQRYANNLLLITNERNTFNAFIKSTITQRGDISLNPVIKKVSDPETQTGFGAKLVPSINEKENFYVVQYRAIANSSEITGAFQTQDDTDSAVFNIFFNDIGKKNISNFSKDNIGALIAVIMDEKVVSAPIISSHLKDGSISIFGNLPEDQIFKMNLFLNYGSLPSELKEISNIDLASAQADARLSVLIEAGADINSIDNQGQTAMHWAGKLGSPTFLKLLIKNGGNFLIEDMYGKTALDYTKENKRWALLD